MSKVIIFSGAGISTESGISTFRDSGGLWEQHRIEDVCYAGCLSHNREGTIAFYDKRRTDLKKAKPNRAHSEIAKLKDKYPDEITVITQNVDDLFERAGCKEVMHLHGFLTSVRCMKCHFKEDIGYNELPRDRICPSCSGDLRPDIVFFGEAAPMYAPFYNVLAECEMFISIGTSGNVIDLGFAGSIQKSVLNNLEASEVIDESLFDLVIYDKATVAIDRIVTEVENFLGQH